MIDDSTYAAAPDELKALKQWVLWRYETRGGKQTKVPYNAGNLARASSTNPDTWASFEDARRAQRRRNLTTPHNLFGLGFVFSPDDLYCGIDIDRCVDDDLNLNELACEILNLLTRDGANIYAELSPSRTGVHIICRARWPGAGGMNNQRLGLEAYDRGRYFTITGAAIDDAAPPDIPLSDAQEAVDALYAEYASQPTDFPTEGAEGDPAQREGQSPELPATWRDLKLVVDPEAEPPAMKFADLFQVKGFKATWEHTRDTASWKNASQSGYDMAVGRFAQEAGWSNQEICNLLIAHRREYNAGRLDRLDYYQRTIFKLRQTARHQEALAALDDADELTASDKPAIKQLIMDITGLKIERYVQISRSPASYVVHLAPHGDETIGETVVLPTSADARSQNAWQDIAQEVLGAPFFAIKPAKWHQFLKCLAVLREYDAVPEASHAQELISLLRRYGRMANELAEGEQPTAEDIRSQSALRQGRDLLFNLPDFKGWLAAHGSGAPLKGIMGRLRAAGVSRDTLYNTDEKGQARRRYWRITLTED